MKKFLCWMLCAVMILSMAACGKKAEESSEKDTPSEQVETTTAAVSKTDKNAKAEDVIKAAQEALEKEDTVFGFSADGVLDLTLKYDAPQSGSEDEEPDMMQMIIGMIGPLLLDEKNELNIRLQPKANGLADTGKGISADVELGNNLAGKVKSILAALEVIESENDPELAWLTDTLTTKLYQDKESEKLYFLNPMSGEWNYTEAKVSDFLPVDTEKEQELKLDELLEDGYEWKITDTQYLLNGKIDLKGLALSALGELDDPEDRKEAEEELDKVLGSIALKVAMTFDDEKRLESFGITMDAYDLPLEDSLPGLGIRLNQFEIKAAYDYSVTERFAVPAEVAEKATELAVDDPLSPVGPGESEYPWAGDEYDLSNAVLIDNDNCKLTVTEAKADEFGDITVKFAFENKSEKNLSIRLNDMYLNGLQWNGFIHEDAEAGSTVDADLDIYSSEMVFNGQEHVYTIDLFLEVREEDNWFDDPLVEEHCKLVLQDGEPAPVQPDDDLKLIDADGLKAWWKSEIERSEWSGAYFSFYGENEKDLPVRFEVTKLLVNGHEVEDIWWDAEIMPGFAAFCRDSVGNDFLKDNGIEEITQLEGTIRAYSVDEDYEETVYAENDFVITYQEGDVSVTVTPAES